MSPRSNDDIRGLPPSRQKHDRRISIQVHVTIDASGYVVGVMQFAPIAGIVVNVAQGGDGIYRACLVIDPEPLP